MPIREVVLRFATGVGLLLPGRGRRGMLGWITAVVAVVHSWRRWNHPVGPPIGRSAVDEGSRIGTEGGLEGAGVDPVDEASVESFPASDPPAFAAGPPQSAPPPRRRARRTPAPERTRSDGHR